LFFGLVGVAMIIFQGGLAHWLIHRLGLLPVLRGGALVFGASALLAAWTESFWGVAILGLTAFAGSTLALPVLNTIASGVVAAHERGTMMGLTASGAALGRVIGPLVSGWVLAQADFAGAWSSLSLVLLLLLLWSFLDGRRYASTNRPT
jgi:MFS family permease